MKHKKTQLMLVFEPIVIHYLGGYHEKQRKRFDFLITSQDFELQNFREGALQSTAQNSFPTGD